MRGEPTAKYQEERVPAVVPKLRDSFLIHWASASEEQDAKSKADVLPLYKPNSLGKVGLPRTSPSILSNRPAGSNPNTWPSSKHSPSQSSASGLSTPLRRSGRTSTKGFEDLQVTSLQYPVHAQQLDIPSPTLHTPRTMRTSPHSPLYSPTVRLSRRHSLGNESATPPHKKTSSARAPSSAQFHRQSWSAQDETEQDSKSTGPSPPQASECLLSRDSQQSVGAPIWEPSPNCIRRSTLIRTAELAIDTVSPKSIGNTMPRFPARRASLHSGTEPHDVKRQNGNQIAAATSASATPKRHIRSARVESPPRHVPNKTKPLDSSHHIPSESKTIPGDGDIHGPPHHIQHNCQDVAPLSSTIHSTTDPDSQSLLETNLQTRPYTASFSDRSPHAMQHRRSGRSAYTHQTAIGEESMLPLSKESLREMQVPSAGTPLSVLCSTGRRSSVGALQTEGQDTNFGVDSIPGSSKTKAFRTRPNEAGLKTPTVSATRHVVQKRAVEPELGGILHCGTAVRAFRHVDIKHEIRRDRRQSL